MSLLFHCPWENADVWRAELSAGRCQLNFVARESGAMTPHDQAAVLALFQA